MAEQVEQDRQEGGVVKTALIFLVCFAVAVAYYLAIDKFLMGPIQNLPFPYK